jgi:hypothetical protein
MTTWSTIAPAAALALVTAVASVIAIATSALSRPAGAATAPDPTDIEGTSSAPQ